MEWKLLLMVFAAVLIAEMADKTQLVTMLIGAWTLYHGLTTVQ